MERTVILPVLIAFSLLILVPLGAQEVFAELEIQLDMITFSGSGSDSATFVATKGKADMVSADIDGFGIATDSSNRYECDLELRENDASGTLLGTTHVVATLLSSISPTIFFIEQGDVGFFEPPASLIPGNTYWLGETSCSGNYRAFVSLYGSLPTLPEICGEGTTLNTSTNECEADVTQSQLDALQDIIDDLNLEITQLLSQIQELLDNQVICGEGTIQVGNECISDTVPEVTITALPSTGVAPLIVDFTCSVVGGNGELNFEWDFGDGESSSLQNPTHTYDDADVFTAECVVTDEDGDFGSSSTDVTVKSPNLTVTVDIKPGSDENLINCKSNGVTPIAIFGDPDFDATTIDLSSLAFNDVPLSEKHNKLHLEDFNLDGIPDVLIHIETKDICLFIPDGTPIRTPVQITFTAEIERDERVEGSDNVIIKGKKILEN